MGFVEDEDGTGGLDEVDGCFALEPVGGLVDDVDVGFVEGGEGHDHEFDAFGEGELANLGEVGGVVGVVAVGCVVEELAEMFLGDLECFEDAFADGDAGDDDDEFAESVALEEFEGGADVDVGFAGAGFHFDGEVGEVDGLGAGGGVGLAFEEVELGVAVVVGVLVGGVEGAFLDGLEVAKDGGMVELEPVGDGGDAAKLELEIEGQVALAVEEVGDGVDGLELKVLVGVELEFHDFILRAIVHAKMFGQY